MCRQNCIRPHFWYNRRLFCSEPHNLVIAMRNLILSAACLAAVAGTAVEAADALASGDVEAGRLKAYTCTGCHGIPGYNNVYPTYKVPKIAGQNEQYLSAALKAYQAGERHHATMELQAKSLSDQDIEDIAAYFATLGGDN